MKARLILWMVLMAAITLILYQNREFCLSEQSLSFDLFFSSYTLPPVANAMQVLIPFLTGLIMACASLYCERFQLRRQIKELHTAFESCAIQVAKQQSFECPSPPKMGWVKIKGLLRRNKTKREAAAPEADHLTFLPDWKGAPQ